MNPFFSEGVADVDSPPSPLVVFKALLAGVSDVLGRRLDRDSVVAGPVASAGLETKFEALGSDFSTSLNTAVEVVEASILFVNSVIDMCFPGVAFESEVEGVASSEGEPDFELIGVFGYFGVLELEVVFELDAGGL